VNRSVYRGIVTGCNDAFVISEEIKNKLIKTSRKSAEIIKSFVEGKDVKAYSKIIPKNYLIFTRRGIDIEKYPAIKNYLECFKENLMPKPKNWKPKDENDKWSGRKPGEYKWYEIQDSIEYYKEFDKNKIIYPNICKQPEFSYDKEKLYTNQKCFIIPTDDLFLLGILNSELAYFWFEMYLPKLRGGFYEPSYVIFKNFPVIKIDLKDNGAVREKENIIKNVEKLLALTEKNSKKDTQKECLYLKNEVNKSVYKLYGISKPASDHIMEILENVKRK